MWNYLSIKNGADFQKIMVLQWHKTEMVLFYLSVNVLFASNYIYLI